MVPSNFPGVLLRINFLLEFYTKIINFIFRIIFETEHPYLVQVDSPVLAFQASSRLASDLNIFFKGSRDFKHQVTEQEGPGLSLCFESNLLFSRPNLGTGNSSSTEAAAVASATLVALVPVTGTMEVRMARDTQL